MYEEGLQRCWILRVCQRMRCVRLLQPGQFSHELADESLDMSPKDEVTFGNETCLDPGKENQGPASPARAKSSGTGIPNTRSASLHESGPVWGRGHAHASPVFRATSGNPSQWQKAGEPALRVTPALHNQHWHPLPPLAQATGMRHPSLSLAGNWQMSRQPGLTGSRVAIPVTPTPG